MFSTVQFSSKCDLELKVLQIPVKHLQVTFYFSIVSVVFGSALLLNTVAISYCNI